MKRWDTASAGTVAFGPRVFAAVPDMPMGPSDPPELWGSDPAKRYGYRILRDTRTDRRRGGASNCVRTRMYFLRDRANAVGAQ